MRRLTFTNAKGEGIVFYKSPYLITKLEGIGEVEADAQTQSAPYQDGATYIDTRLQPRSISMEGEFTKLYNLEDIREHRSRMQRVLSPKLGLGRITLEFDGAVKEILAVVDGTPAFPDKQRSPIQSFLVNFLAPDPYWKDPEETSRALRAYQGGLTLPFTLPFELSVTGDTTTLDNQGDEPTPVQIDIQGPVTNPRITNKTTGQFIQMNQSISADEILHLDTSPRAIRAELYREGYAIRKVLGWRDPESDFWLLEPGENEIQFIADAGGNNAAVAVSWQNRYLGI
ncbi:phage tail family protein [Halobacillus shinanisalinarum]|uniref:Phage tail family protein n=1 Tax=Halobacillus shinanisalinarum TaxID=2932258 RepID=A0ABY4GZ21_9BACI|nr:phage tail family protein [Halobacillus shinanisalinarum]UOQ93418.1 phage tail family protein [Halobacillus shinanisalinarum]